MPADQPPKPEGEPGSEPDERPRVPPGGQAEHGASGSPEQQPGQAASADALKPNAEGEPDPAATGQGVETVAVPSVDEEPTVDEEPSVAEEPSVHPSDQTGPGITVQVAVPSFDVESSVLGNGVVAAAPAPSESSATQASGPEPRPTVGAEAILGAIGRDARVSFRESRPEIGSTTVRDYVSGSVRLGDPPTYIEVAGTELARYAGLIIAIFTVLIIVYWMLGLWMFGVQFPPPSLPIPLPSDSATLAQLTTDYGRLSTNHQAMWDAHQARTTGFFDTVVARTLLPVLTAILGYIFGAQRMVRPGRESSSEASPSPAPDR